MIKNKNTIYIYILYETDRQTVSQTDNQTIKKIIYRQTDKQTNTKQIKAKLN